MKKLLAMAMLATAAVNTHAIENQPDSLYLFSYTTDHNKNHDGLHFAWSIDNKSWHKIGDSHNFVSSDYGPWGSGKRMIDPVLLRRPDGKWVCTWLVNEDGKVIANTETDDLVLWKPQDYYAAGDKKNGNRNIERQQVTFPDGDRLKGIVIKVERAVVNNLIAEYERSQYRNARQSELMRDDPMRFKGLKDVTFTVTANPNDKKAISPELFGIFFEDINYAADGGLYAELLQNRDFEYTPHDVRGRNKDWNATYAWSIEGEGITMSIDTVAPLHPNNSHYALLDISTTGSALVNAGWDGVAVKAGEKYDFSMFAKSEKVTPFELRIVDKDGNVIARRKINIGGKGWKQTKTVVVPDKTVSDGRLELRPLATGKVAVDFISLFPQNTFKGRKNGMRKDLAEKLVDLHPRFVRFPGGCLAHGNGLHNIYRWKNTIGELWERKGMRNIWNYHQTMGLGYYEYFRFCEDIGATPLPVIAAGVPCQNSSDGGDGQQGGLPMEEMQQYIQDILDLVEWARGDKSTKWGSLRAKAGHPKPFDLKYIGIGNEDLISDVFTVRYKMICEAVKAKYPDIQIVGTAGPFNRGSDYEYGWKLANEMNLDIIDEHYYVPSGWMIYNQDFYDSYDRNKTKVYLGEYASHTPGKKHNMESALTTALYLASVERNADVVRLSSYAPLLSRRGHQQWSHNLIYFDNASIRLTTDYHVQKLYGRNAGDEYIPCYAKADNNRENVRLRIGHSIVRDSKTGDIIIKLMNLLPVKVNTKLNLEGILGTTVRATAETMAGKPADEGVAPVKTELEVSPMTDYEMSPYSFTVIRLNPEGTRLNSKKK